jgi:hypothetical protein
MDTTDNIAQENILKYTRDFLYALIWDKIRNQPKNDDGKRFIEFLPYHLEIETKPTHIRENIENVLEEMVKNGFMEPIEDKRYKFNKFMVTKTGYYEVSGLNKKREEKPMKTEHTINIGDNVKININSTDKSITNNFTLNNSQLQNFNKLVEIATSLPNNDEILRSITEMKSAFEKNDKTKFKEKYDAFIQSVANHMTLFNPFIQFLTQ